MKKFLAVLFILVFAAGTASAADFHITLPDSGWGIETDITSRVNDINEEFGAFFNKYGDAEDLARGLGNASAYASDGGYIRSAMDYKWISVSLACNGAVVFDDSGLDEFLDDYHSKGDIYAGAGLQALVGTVGFNLGHMLEMEKGLYVTLKAGKSTMEAEDIDFESHLFGVMVNYQLIKPASKLGFGWNGINVGAGLTYYYSEMEWKDDGLGSISHSWTDGSITKKINMKPELETKAEVSGFVVPVEIITGVSALKVLDVYAGLGADIMFGRDSELEYTGKGIIRYDDGTGSGWDALQGDVSASGKVEGDDDFIRFKAMAGLGLSLGPVHLEVPFAIYFEDAISCSAGVIGGISF